MPISANWIEGDGDYVERGQVRSLCPLDGVAVRPLEVVEPMRVGDLKPWRQPASRCRRNPSLRSIAVAQFSASLRPELLVGLKLWSPLGIYGEANTAFCEATSKRRDTTCAGEWRPARVASKFVSARSRYPAPQSGV